MKSSISHSVHGDRVLLTAEVGAEAVTSRGSTVEITMDDADWRDTARAVLRQSQRAANGSDPDALADRVTASLRRSVRHVGGCDDPEIARRRAVESALRRVGDLVLAGSVRAIAVTWGGSTEITITTLMGRGDDERSTSDTVTIDVEEIVGRAR